eukprot:3943432-Pleurochrysis_carterae.AAC.2
MYHSIVSPAKKAENGYKKRHPSDARERPISQIRQHGPIKSRRCVPKHKLWGNPSKQTPLPLLCYHHTIQHREAMPEQAPSRLTFPLCELVLFLLAAFLCPIPTPARRRARVRPHLVGCVCLQKAPSRRRANRPSIACAGRNKRIHLAFRQQV